MRYHYISEILYRKEGYITMKKLFRLGGIISMILALVLFGEIFFKDDFNKLFTLVDFNFKSELFLLMHIIFLYILKKYMNIKFYIHSEELRFLLLFILLILSKGYKYIKPEFFDKSKGFNVHIILILGILVYFLELNIFNRLRQKVKDKACVLTLFIFICAVFAKMLYIVSGYLLMIFSRFNIDFAVFDKVTELNVHIDLFSKSLYIAAYILMAFIFLKPKETYSF